MRVATICVLFFLLSSCFLSEASATITFPFGIYSGTAGDSDFSQNLSPPFPASLNVTTEHEGADASNGIGTYAISELSIEDASGHAAFELDYSYAVADDGFRSRTQLSVQFSLDRPTEYSFSGLYNNNSDDLAALLLFGLSGGGTIFSSLDLSSFDGSGFAVTTATTFDTGQSTGILPAGDYIFSFSSDLWSISGFTGDSGTASGTLTFRLTEAVAVPESSSISYFLILTITMAVLRERTL